MLLPARRLQSHNKLRHGHFRQTAKATTFHITKDHRSLTPEHLNDNTLFVTFSPETYIRVPVIGMSNPAALFCNLIEHQGSDDPAISKAADGKLLVVDESQDLFEWKTECEKAGQGWFVEPEFMQSELRGFVDDEGLSGFKPVLYCAPIGK
jgi:hypothetical protein